MNYTWFNLEDIPDELLVKIVKEEYKMFCGDSLVTPSVAREILRNTRKEDRGKFMDIDHVFSKAMRVAAIRYCEKVQMNYS